VKASETQKKEQDKSILVYKQLIAFICCLTRVDLWMPEWYKNLGHINSENLNFSSFVGFNRFNRYIYAKIMYAKKELILLGLSF